MRLGVLACAGLLAGGCSLSTLVEWGADYTPPSDAAFQRSIDIQQRAELGQIYFCAPDNERFSIANPEYRDGEICGRRRPPPDGDADQNAAETCIAPGDVAHIGVPKRKLVVGTPAGPGRCPSSQ